MPLTKEEIKARSEARRGSAYVSPNYGDGGWHTTPGMNEFSTEWEPMGDRILVRLAPIKQPSSIVALTDASDTSRFGTVLKVGPGKFRDGHWYKRGVTWKPDKHGIQQGSGGVWEWIPGQRIPLTLRPGDNVVIGRWHDWSTLESGWGEEIVLCQEADVRVLCG